MPLSITDERGAYRLRVPAAGRTRICASDEAAGYPDTTAAIFASGREAEPEVNLTPNAELHDVDIHLDTPDGRIELVITDGKNGGAVQNARITLRRRETPEIMYSSDIAPGGRFEADLPKRPITIALTAPGYRRWTYVDALSGNDFVELQSREDKVIRVEMIPDSGPH